MNFLICEENFLFFFISVQRNRDCQIFTFIIFGIDYSSKNSKNYINKENMSFSGVTVLCDLLSYVSSDKTNIFFCEPDKTGRKSVLPVGGQNIDFPG
jgi:hypothetical protein